MCGDGIKLHEKKVIQVHISNLLHFSFKSLTIYTIALYFAFCGEMFVTAKSLIEEPVEYVAYLKARVAEIHGEVVDAFIHAITFKALDHQVFI